MPSSVQGTLLLKRASRTSYVLMMNQAEDGLCTGCASRRGAAAGPKCPTDADVIAPSSHSLAFTAKLLNAHNRQRLPPGAARPP